MASQQDKSIKTFVGSNISKKQFKTFLANAKTPAERRAIKNMVLGEPVKFFGKNVEAEDANELKTNLTK